MFMNLLSSIFKKRKSKEKSKSTFLGMFKLPESNEEEKRFESDMRFYVIMGFWVLAVVFIKIFG